MCNTDTDNSLSANEILFMAITVHAPCPPTGPTKYLNFCCSVSPFCDGAQRDQKCFHCLFVPRLQSHPWFGVRTALPNLTSELLHRNCCKALPACVSSAICLTTKLTQSATACLQVYTSTVLFRSTDWAGRLRTRCPQAPFTSMMPKSGKKLRTMMEYLC